jgi:thiosulfate/3-mercaptopyruvate sulfurtransferase
VATKEEVKAATNDENVVLVNALWPELFRGEAKTPLERPGRIPGSVNVPFTETVNEDGTLKAPDEVRTLFAQAGASDGEIITYCGGGIAATYDALALATAGIDAAVYDGSLVEWVADPELELETG